MKAVIREKNDIMQTLAGLIIGTTTTSPSKMEDEKIVKESVHEFPLLSELDPVYHKPEPAPKTEAKKIQQNMGWLGGNIFLAPDNSNSTADKPV